VAGCSTMRAPTTSPGPVRKFSTPFGSPCFQNSSQICQPMAGLCSAGLNTTVLPVTSADAIMPAGMAQGKFHGGMTAPTPSGI
jgi:hypothetical protein